MNNWKQKLLEGKRFVFFVVNHFIDDDCTYRASALTYTTLLALVPLMSVSFSILSMFPVFDDLSDPIQNFIFQNFVPATGDAIQAYLQHFTQQVSRLSIVGVIFLFITALLLMYTIESAMNKIWRVSTQRHGTSAFLLYWAILSLAPFLLGLSVAASSYFFSLPFTPTDSTLRQFLTVLPWLFSLVGFTFLYVVVPNCKVRLVHGFIGAIVATILFETAKAGFAYYLGQYNTYQLLYGAFAIIPIFFIWIYWVWLITLLGAEISYALSVHHKRRVGPAIDGFSQGLLFLHTLWLAQVEGNNVSKEALISTSKNPFAIDIGDMIGILEDLQLIKMTGDGNYILSRDLNHFSLYDLAQVFPFRLPREKDIISIDSSIEKHWHDLIEKTDKALYKYLNISLDELFRTAEAENEPDSK